MQYRYIHIFIPSGTNQLEQQGALKEELEHHDDRVFKTAVGSKIFKVAVIALKVRKVICCVALLPIRRRPAFLCSSAPRVHVEGMQSRPWPYKIHRSGHESSSSFKRPRDHTSLPLNSKQNVDRPPHHSVPSFQLQMLKQDGCAGA